MGKVSLGFERKTPQPDEGEKVRGTGVLSSTLIVQLALSIVRRGLARGVISFSGSRCHTEAVLMTEHQQAGAPNWEAAHPQHIRHLNSVMPAAKMPGEEMVSWEQMT